VADTYLTIGSNGIKKKLHDNADTDATYSDVVYSVPGTFPPGTTSILAKATGSTDGLGKVAALAASEHVYVRCDCSGADYAYVDWLLNTTAKVDLGFYVANVIEDEVTLTVGSLADTETIILNGLTYTSEATANTAAYASRKFSVAGTDTEDAAALAALINADYAVVTAGTSVAATDKLIFTTDEGTTTIAAAAAADYPNHQYALNSTAATEAASIILAINHKDNVTCASVSVGDTVTVGGVTYTAAAAEDTATHTFAQITSDDATGTSLAACVNADTTAQSAHGISASNSSGVVSFTRAAEANTVGLASSNATRLKTEACGGVPGVIAAASGVSAEIKITPTWTKVLTLTESGDQLTVTDIDCPGVYATSAEAVVTLVPGTPASRTEGDLAPVIQAVTGTAAGHCVVAQTATLAGLQLVNDYGTNGLIGDVAANNTTAGTLYHVPTYGYDYAYVDIYADGTTPTIVVSATPRV
jgi:hypothetical protein